LSGLVSGTLPLRQPWVSSAVVEHGPVQCSSDAVCGVLPGANYIFEVQAIDERGTTSLSPRSDALLVPDAKPSACRGLLVRQLGPAELRLAWQPPALDGGSKILAYQVISVSHESSGKPLAPICETVKWDSGQHPHWIHHEVTGLCPESFLSFSVSAENSVGVGVEATATAVL
ncbi:unnamed protein product, partial [Polarella glacialis]